MGENYFITKIETKGKREEEPMKKLYKIEKGKKICGVCGGIAEYFNLDPTLVRILWALFTIIFFGGGIIVYIIASIVMPKKEDVCNEIDVEEKKEEKK